MNINYEECEMSERDENKEKFDVSDDADIEDN